MHLEEAEEGEDDNNDDTNENDDDNIDDFKDIDKEKMDDDNNNDSEKEKTMSPGSSLFSLCRDSLTAGFAVV